MKNHRTYFGLLIMTIAAPFADILVYSKLVVRGDIEATVQNLQADRGLLLAGILAYLITFIMDLLVALALYVLLIPVNQALSLLAAWFRVVYTAIALFAMLKLVGVYRLLNPPGDQTISGSEALHGRVEGLVNQSFRNSFHHVHAVLTHGPGSSKLFPCCNTLLKLFVKKGFRNFVFWRRI